MTTVNVHEAKTHLSALLDKVLAGDEVVIARGPACGTAGPRGAAPSEEPRHSQGPSYGRLLRTAAGERVGCVGGYRVRVLLDTHALLWWLFDDPRLSRRARAAIASPDTGVLVSAASAWEIATKHRLGKLPEAGDVAARLPAYMRKAAFQEMPVSVAHALAAGALPGPHRDPFDRMLIAQSLGEDIQVITHDPVFREYGARVLW
jgi:PIN domain nuclease of toxin-antitoxin system